MPGNKSNRRSLPVVLVIAGSDSGGGAGIQADLKAIHQQGAHGLTILTAVTAQNPCRVSHVEPMPARLIRRQWDSVVEGFPIHALKTGMLADDDIVREVVRIRLHCPTPPLVVDPVMISTSGRSLLSRKAVQRLEEDLLPLATLVTPNLAEAAHWYGRFEPKPLEMACVARTLAQRWKTHVLLKGGHAGGRQSRDVLSDGHREWWFENRRVPGVQTHGTGCTLASLIASRLAFGDPICTAVATAKKGISHAIRNHRLAGKHPVLGLRFQ